MVLVDPDDYLSQVLYEISYQENKRHGVMAAKVIAIYNVERKKYLDLAQVDRFVQG